MDFSTVESLAEESLNMTGSAVTVEVGLLYYGGFAATLPAMLVSLWLLLRGRDWTAGLCMSLLIVAGAWLRLYAATVHAYSFALLSTVLLGIAGGVIFTSFTSIPERWFPEHERGIATAMAVQSNYAGWAIGVLNPAMFGGSLFGNASAPTEGGLDHFLVVQGVVATCLLPLHLLANSRGPLTKHAGASSSSSGGGGGSGVPPSDLNPALGFGATLAMLVRRPQYLIHSACYAVLGAVGYAVTGIMNECFSAALPPLNVSSAASNGTASSSAFDAEETMWLNFVFVVSGVSAGLLAGKLTPLRHYGTVVKALFVVGAGALLGVQALLLVAQHGSLSKQSMFAMLLVLMMLAGAGSLGFTSLGLRVAVGESRPAAEIYSGSIIEFFLLGISCTLGLLTYVLPPTQTFWFFAIPACASCACLFCFAKFPRAEDLHEGLIAHQDDVRVYAGAS